MPEPELQEVLDAFYHEHGPCCAGCDWWRSHNSRVGECHRARIVPGRERADMLGITNTSMPVPAGHPFTPREHVCGEFKDGFDWASLPLQYRKRIGEPKALADRAPTRPDAEARGG